MHGKPIPNQDPATGICYGIISANDVMSEALDDIYQCGTDLGFESALAEVKADVQNATIAAYDAETEEKRLAALWENEWLCDDAANLAGLIADADSQQDAIETVWNEVEQSACDGLSYGESGPYAYDDGETFVRADSDNDIWIFKSPFYTLCRECSPCAPNAGYLTSQPGSKKTYCLGVDWFENEIAPYPVYRVADDSVVFTPEDTEDN